MEVYQYKTQIHLVPDKGNMTKNIINRSLSLSLEIQEYLQGIDC